jgi:outer membrane protein OmpA-like peptidoglycan-associated protein
MSTRRALALMAVVAVCAGACASKRGAVVVLLPEPEGGAVGRASVSNTAGAVDLDSGRDATRVRVNEAPGRVSTMSDADVQRLFGDALGALPPPTRRFVLNFRFESDKLTDESSTLVPEILAVVRERSLANVAVTGHTDTMGTPQANYQLGLKRATMVRNLLIRAGLEAARIEVSSLGETDPLVPTADNTAEPRNRRVDIAVR